jgi:hypothetical protein
MIGRDLGTPLSPIIGHPDKRTAKKSSKLLHTLDQIDMVDIYRVFYPILGNTYSFLQLMQISPK